MAATKDPVVEEMQQRLDTLKQGVLLAVKELILLQNKANAVDLDSANLLVSDVRHDACMYPPPHMTCMQLSSESICKRCRSMRHDTESPHDKRMLSENRSN